MTSESLMIGSIGAGSMAKALMNGMILSGLAKPENILAADIKDEARESFTALTGARAVENGAQVLKEHRQILLAVKPQQVAAVLESLRPHAGPEHLFISIIAGVRAKTIEDALGEGTRVIRVMPNTPALLGAGAAGVARGTHAGPEDLQMALRILQAVGVAVEVPEDLIDSVTAVSGSGPAYFFLFVESLIDAGVAVGLPPETAQQLAKQTVLGAARMLTERPETPEQLRVAVTSPGGTTEAALKRFEEEGLAQMVHNAVRAARDRGVELGQT